MKQRPSTVQVAGGDGLVARFGEVVLYSDARGEGATQLLAAAEAASVARFPGEVVASQLAPVVFGVAVSAAVGVVAPTETGYVVLVHGPAVAIIETRNGARRLTGRPERSWVSETVHGAVPTVGFSGVAVGRPTPDLHSDLRAGVVPGGGVVMVGEMRSDTSGRTKTIVIKSTPVQHPPAEASATTRLASIEDTAAAVAVSGVLVGPNGALYPLDRSYVIGRAPISDDGVHSADASPIVVPYDPYASRVHAYVTVQGTGVFVRDAATASGTFVAPPGAYSWTRLGPAPTRIEPGWSVRIGDWIVTYQIRASD